MDKRKRFKLTMEIFRDIFKICPRVQGQDFDALPSDDEIMSFLRDLGHTREIYSLMMLQLVLTSFVSPEHKSFETLSWRNKIGMHTSRDDNLINTLRFVSAKEETQIYGAIRPESLTSPEMKETKAYKTYLAEEPTGKSKRVNRPAKKSTKAPARGVVIRETPEMPLSKKKEKVDVTQGKGIELLSQVALTKDVHDQENDSDYDKTQSDNENELTSEHETDENESGSKSDQEENKEDEDDEEEMKDEFVKTSSNDSDDEDETKITDKAEGDEDEEMDYTTSQLYDDVDIRLNEPVDTDKGFVQEEGTDAAMTNRRLNPPPQQSTSTPPPTTEATSPLSTLPDFASVFQFNNRVTALEKEVAKLKKDPLHTQVTTLVDDHLDARLGATRDEFMNFLSASLTARVTKQSLEDAVLAKESSQPQSSYEAAATLTEFELKKILIDKLDKSESYLAAPEHSECYEGLIKSYDLDKTIFSTYDRGLKKRKTSKDTEPTKGSKAKESQSGSSKGTKSQPKSYGKSVQSEELEFEVAYSDMPQDQEENPGNYDKEPKEKVASKCDWFTKPT
ncbi:hypothetical protein Tco_1391741 [Tanacetum coccineum]